jgi:hypothetical protein
LAELRSDEGNLASKFRVKYFILCLSVCKNEGSNSHIIDKIEHGDESASCHKRIITSLVTAVRFDVRLNKFIVNVGVGLQQLLVEACFV